MASNILYDKSGGEHKVPHSIDRKDWLATGDFFIENPKPKQNKKNDKQPQQNLLDDKE